MLPHEPEAVEAMRARFPAALDEVFTRDELLLGYQIQPGARRRHVFGSVPFNAIFLTISPMISS